MIVGGAPGGIVSRFLVAAVETDRRALEAIGQSLSGKDRPLVAAFGTSALKPGRLAAEDDTYDPNFIGGPGARTEDRLRELAALGIRTSAIRLPPIVHGAGDHGFAPQLIAIARKKKESGYIGDGLNRWPSVHQRDAARLFRLAPEKGPAGGTYHGVAEEGIPFREIAGLIGQFLNVPLLANLWLRQPNSLAFLAPSSPSITPHRALLPRNGWDGAQSSPGYSPISHPQTTSRRELTA